MMNPNLRSILLISLTTAVVLSSIATLSYLYGNTVLLAHENPSFRNLLILPGSLDMGMVVYDKTSLNQSTRIAIYNIVRTNPGIHFRGVCSYLVIPIGVAQYHLNILTREGLISSIRDGRYKRYFQSKKFGEKEMIIISALRHETTGEILITLSQEDTISIAELASKHGITDSALTWQMNRLREMGLVELAPDGTRRYLLTQGTATMVKRCIAL